MTPSQAIRQRQDPPAHRHLRQQLVDERGGPLGPWPASMVGWHYLSASGRPAVLVVARATDELVHRLRGVQHLRGGFAAVNGERAIEEADLDEHPRLIPVDVLVRDLVALELRWRPSGSPGVCRSAGLAFGWRSTGWEARGSPPDILSQRGEMLRRKGARGGQELSALPVA
jgi:hypothetical protein